MAFNTYEASQEGSRPIELYTFTVGAVITRYASAEDTITESADDYVPAAIQRSKLVGGGPDSRNDAITLTLPGDDQLVRQYINSVPGVAADVVIERIQRTDGVSYEVVRIFEGRIESVAFESGGRVAKIQVVPRVRAQSRPIPRCIYSGLCNHVLYDARCQVDDTDPAYKLANTLVTDETGNTITVTGAAAYGDGFFTGGFVEAGGGADHRLILSHTGNVLVLHLPFASSVDGVLVNVYAGCDHTPTTCKSKFDNIVNFGGFPFVPTKNPFQTGLST